MPEVAEMAEDEKSSSPPPTGTPKFEKKKKATIDEKDQKTNGKNLLCVKI